jgi:broad specificity phosphatase PhoE
MARLYMVRHGEAAAGFGEHDDPGLSEKGRGQAEAAAKTLFDLGLKDSISSPLLRCQETAAPFVKRVGQDFRIEEAVAEIPTPPAHALGRQVWLRGVMAGAWADQPDFTPWRMTMLKTLIAVKSDLAIFSHFVAINVAVGLATGNDKVVNFSPANGSITVLETDGQTLKFVSFGAEAAGGKVL